MNAAQLLTGRGGWPLNVFALPDGKPFYAGTYFTKNQWIRVLQQISYAYENKHAEVVKQADALTKGIKVQGIINISIDTAYHFTKNSYRALFANWQSTIDFDKGGFKNNTKFPLPTSWEFLLQYYYLTENKKALDAVTTTLDAMERGGIYDQIGGGFARYSTDTNWFVPHFEKMLYDNGQLVSLYANAYKVTHNPEYARVIRETLQFVKREMTSPQGGFYSSISSDSKDEEGKFYVWTNDQIRRVLTVKMDSLIIDYYHIKPTGNWKNNKNILYRNESDPEFATKHNLSLKEWNKILVATKNKLLDERNKRVHPYIDKKILTGWNALMMKGYIDAYVALGDKSYLQTAIRNARFLEKNMICKNGKLWRNYLEDKAGIDAFLVDYALLADAYIQLYQATFNIHWLNLAKQITNFAIAHFMNKNIGMFYYTSDQTKNLIARTMEITDNVIPASNSVMANVLYRLGEYYGQKTYIQISKTMLHLVADKLSKDGPYFSNWAKLMGLIAYKPYEVAIIGNKALEKNKSLHSQYLPTALFMGGNKEDLPLLKNKLVKGKTLIYMCHGKTYKLPVTDVQQALKQLK